MLSAGVTTDNKVKEIISFVMTFLHNCFQPCYLVHQTGVIACKVSSEFVENFDSFVFTIIGHEPSMGVWEKSGGEENHHRRQCHEGKRKVPSELLSSVANTEVDPIRQDDTEDYFTSYQSDHYSPGKVI